MKREIELCFVPLAILFKEALLIILSLGEANLFVCIRGRSVPNNVGRNAREEGLVHRIGFAG
ncbi:hypothetical protein EJ04DRAFT_516478 [Polyplosphaeria fusca]|uniref:Uncharacterized protein n=1 Tax=Polyplosphaeria fusca TaxID=682080 RepID=A0A9P4UX93_9PLEO|nr:hypothetical protein EJ04DRAFT_516478 [Polyplosphaeria fusca]